MSNLTIRDIARMAGLSSTAVSFVLNNRPGVSDATREKVQEIIRSTGYTPNAHTRKLNLGKSFTFHVVLHRHASDLANQFVLEMLHGIFIASRDLGYSVIFTFVDQAVDCEQLMESVRSKECDGLILIQIRDPMFIAVLQQEQIPFVCVDSHIDRGSCLPMVEVDYYGAARQATEYLCRCGHSKIGFLGLSASPEYDRLTFRGYTDALEKAGLVCDPAWVCRTSVMPEAAESDIRRLLEGPRLPTALLCAGDILAIIALRCIKARGLRVPEDLSLIGMDDLVVSRYLDPPLTTMNFDKEQLGIQAVELLYQIISQRPYTADHFLPTALVERSSVRIESDS